MKISIVIPAYNEEFRLPSTLSTIIEFTSKRSEDFELIVVDDGSRDNTVQVAKNFEGKVLVLALDRNLGKGAAVRLGMLEAKGDYIFFSDADLSTPISELDKLLNELKNSSDIAIGSRAVDFSSIKIHQPFYREFMGKTFNQIVQLLVVKGIKDTQCGFKGFSHDSAKNVFGKSKINGFGFDVEILYLARRMGYKIKEISVEWFNDEQSKINPITDSFKMLMEIIRIRNLHKKTKF
jgi:dolichyl-phosphate beta-glucosyltransferase